MTQTLNSSKNCMNTVKFLYSYGGKIIPRHTDGKLRYVGGSTRVLSVDYSVTFSELIVKFGEACGSSVDLKCKLPSEDLDVLISIKSDEDLRSVIEEYERASPEAKIRAVLFPVKSAKKVSPPSSPMSCFDFPSALKPPSSPMSCFDFPSALKPPRVKAPSAFYHSSPPCTVSYRCFSPAVGYPFTVGKYNCVEGRSSRHFYQMPHRNNSH